MTENENPPFDQAVFTRLLGSLDDAGLPDDEKALLSLLMSIAVEIIDVQNVHVDHDALFTAQFASAFTPAKAKALAEHVELAADAGLDFGITRGITRGYPH